MSLNIFYSIIWPSNVNYAANSATSYTTVTIYGTAYTSFTANVNRGSRTISITGLFASAGITAQASDIVIVIDQFKNPESIITSDTFYIQTTNSGGEGIDKSQQTLTITSDSPGVVTVASVTYTTQTVDQTFSVSLLETTDISPSSGTLRVYWPSEVTYVTSSTDQCTSFFGFSSPISCTVDTTNNYIEYKTYTGGSHYYTLKTFQNPLGVITTSTWRIQVYDSSSNLIMQQLTGMTYTTVK
jgi:hypothetical protein